MRKALFIMAAALVTMTQCKKQETMPVTPADGTVKMTITAGPGRTDINTETGAITWSAGDKLYVSDGTNWLGCLTLVGEGGSAQGTFTGDIAGIDESETPCHFFYLGHDNGMTEPAGTAAVNISFAAQDGTLAGAMKYHIGHGRTDVTVTEGEATGSVIMDTKIAIAHINFTTDGTTAYTGSVTMGGTGIFNTLSVNPDGSTFTGSGNEGITIGNGGGTTGERYVTLIPTTGTDRVDVSFTGDATGSMTFLAGIRENKFYGMKDAIAVTLEAAGPTHEYVDLGLPSGLLWATCNLGASSPEEYGDYYAWGEILPYYADGHSQDSPCSTWRNMTTGAGNTDISNGYAWETYSQGGSDSFVEWTAKPYGSDNILTSTRDAATANWGGDWRMPTKEEWQELYDNTTCTWTTENDVNGCKFTSTKEGYTDKYIFLPAAGNRDGTDVYGAGSNGYYWSSSLYSSYPSCAYSRVFHSDNVDTQILNFRCNGYSVRPVQ